MNLFYLAKRAILVLLLCVFCAASVNAGNGNKRYYQKASYKKKSKKVKLHKAKKKGEKFTLYRHREGTPISN